MTIKNSFIKILTAISLLAGILGCQQLENRIDEVSSRIDDIEKSQGETSKDGEVQSIVFVPEYSDGSVRVYYNTKEDGSFIPEELTLRFAIAPVELVDKLASEWGTFLSIEAVYTKTKAAGDCANLSIAKVEASDGKLIITASADALDQAFFRKELAASVRLTASLEGICKSSEYVPMVPSANMGKGEKLDIPDIYFKTYLVDNFDVNGDGEISSDEALAVKEINIASSSLPIHSLTGIEHFTKLESLDCSGNYLSVLDLSSNAALRYLNCSNNSLTELDLSGMLYLTDVDCSNNKINKLVPSNAAGLKNLNCSNNAVTDLAGFGNCDAMESLAAAGCAISSIDVSNYPSLVRLNVAGNSLQKIDVRNNPMLEELNVSGNALSLIDIRYNIALKNLNISGNRDIFLVNIRNNPVLEDLNVSGLSISELDLTPIAQLKTLDVTYNPDLTRVICPSQDWLNNISEIFASPSLSYADIDGNELYDYIEIDGVKWARWNAGYTEADRYGGRYTFDEAQKACPDGWRVPTKSELQSLSAHRSPKTVFNGMTGLWLSGSETYSSSVQAVFFPYYIDEGFALSYYWSSDESGNGAYSLAQDSIGQILFIIVDFYRSLAVRCLKDL